MTGRHGIVTSLQAHFGTLLLASFVLGALVPPPGEPPALLVPALLGLVLYLAVVRIDPADRSGVRPSTLLGFHVVRFVLLPVGIGGMAAFVAPDLVLPAVVLALLPTGVTTTAVVTILRGNGAVALLVTALSTAVAPVVVPFAVWVVGGPELSPRDVGFTLLGLLVLPVVLHGLVTARSPRLTAALREVGPPTSVVLICVIAFLVASSQQARIRADPLGLLTGFLLGGAFYTVAYGVGLAFARLTAAREAERVAWALAAGNNNIVLGLTLALLHFGPDEVVLFLAWDLAWIVGLSAIQPVLRWTRIESSQD
jgi:BASS family bile acid:Na+ symporter